MPPHALLETLPRGLCVCDPEGRITYVNSACARLLGHMPDELLGLCLWELLSRKGHSKAWQEQLRQLPQGSSTPPIVLRHARGEEPAVDLSIELEVVYEGDRASAVVALVSDVSERVRTERALQESERKYRDVVETSHDLIWSVDTEERITFINAAAKRIFGLEPEEMIGRPYSDFVPDEQMVANRALFEKAAQTGGFPRNYVNEVRHQDGSRIVLSANAVLLYDEDGNVVGLTGVSRDITELVESRRRLEAIFNHSLDAMVLADDDARYVDANAACCRLLGYHREELLGRHLTEIVASEGSRAEEVWRSFREAGTLSGEITLRRKDGAEVEVEYASVADIVPGLHLSAMRDVTARKRAEQALRESHAALQEALEELSQTQEQIVRQERLRAIGQMASGVAHELNNTLVPVIGYSELLADDPSLPHRVRSYVGAIRTGAGDAAAMIDKLQQFYAATDAEAPKELIDLAELSRQIPELTRPKWHDEAQRRGRTIKLRVEAQPSPPVLGAPSELRQVLTNLVFNAVEALTEGGSLTLRVRPDPEGVAVEVEDGGIGMSDVERRHCLEPFFTAKPGGAGLGLSVCHGIVERHGGRIAVDSRAGQGTTVTVVLPAARETSRAGVESERPELPRLRVLLVEDDARVRPVLERLLHRLGLEVTAVADGRQALDAIETGDHDLVMTDLGMPGIDGKEVVLGVRERTAEVPVVMITGWAESTALAEAEPEEMPDAFLAKPPSISSLRHAIDEALRKRAARSGTIRRQT